MTQTWGRSHGSNRAGGARLRNNRTRCDSSQLRRVTALCAMSRTFEWSLLLALELQGKRLNRIHLQTERQTALFVGLTGLLDELNAVP